MALDVLSVIGILSVIMFTNVVLDQTISTEQINMSCVTDDECIERLESCSAYCYYENPHALMGDFTKYNDEQQFGRCVKMMYVDNGEYGECD